MLLPCSRCVFFYLAHARYLSNILHPAEILGELSEETNTISVVNDDSDEGEAFVIESMVDD